MEEMTSTVYLSLGTNLGNRMSNLVNAVRELASSAGTIDVVSSVYESTSWGYDSRNDYLNCCVKIQTFLSPSGLLEEIQRIEKSMGRVKTKKYTDRVIDIDILFYNDLIIKEELLVIPHPHIEKRGFVLLPLVEIAPDLFHSKYFLTIRQLFNNLQQRESIHIYQSFKMSGINN